MRPLFIFFVLFLFCPLAYGQDKGRLADGRAYRIDEQGYRLIDQLAEYEVKVEELRRQVITLEDELIEKNKQIVGFRNRAGSASQLAFKEKDLLKGEPQKPLPPKVIIKERIIEKECAVQTCEVTKCEVPKCEIAKPEIAKPEVAKCEVPKCEIPKLACPAPACSEAELLALKTELDQARQKNTELDRESLASKEILAKLKSEKEQQKQQFEQSASAAKKSQEEQLSALNLLLEQKKVGLTEGERELANLKEELLKEKTKLSEANNLYQGALLKQQEQVAKLTSLDQELVSSNEKLKNKNLEVKEISSKLNAKNEQLALLDQELSREKAKSQELDNKYASLVQSNSATVGETKVKAEQAASLEDKLASKANELTRKDDELKLAQEKLAMLDEKLKEATYVRAKLAPVALATPLAVIPVLDRFSQSKQQLQDMLALVDKKIVERKEISDSVKTRPSYVQIDSSPLSTAGGISLDALRARTQQVGSEKQAQQIISGLKEIKGILDEDIELLKRINNLQ